jgi:hypothetical protein
VPHQSNAVHSIVVAAQRLPSRAAWFEVALVDAPPDGALLAPQNAEVTAVGDLLQGRLTAPEQGWAP